MNIQTCQKRLQRAEKKVAILETMIEEKTRELYLSKESLNATLKRLMRLYHVLPQSLLVTNCEGNILQANKATLNLLAYDEESLIGQPVSMISESIDLAALTSSKSVLHEQYWVNSLGEQIPVLISMARFECNTSGETEYVIISVDLRERKQLELELRHSQKLESVGQLAAGIAHEINTPMQFIGDNVFFLREVFTDMLTLIDSYGFLKLNNSVDNTDLIKQIETIEEDADIEYLRNRVPKAIERTLEGVNRVSTIVSAMKEFSHPNNERTAIDINRSIKTALTVATNEYKYIADIHTELSDIPPVYCNGGDINQVLLNLIINAAHAIEHSLRDNKEERGTILITTSSKNDSVLITITDNGCGIPEKIKHRIYDPFFTTKEVGKGTGQGLSIAYAIVVERHGGSLNFKSEIGQGTSFYLALPIHGSHQNIEVSQ